ncbi:DUF3307 domain-containing protein [Lutimaribacter sp. EGI FJ00015]|uniref:DUF3307 domain-containing protein n=1 Tax=Lutimaribacter degradans TaxID=2945989 RepID=A0ACC5ZSS4_9RHOB|nr:DUF3307 domain-containing protein [Lutimaribacter sp. EGI FJ00013]MCM2561332.1 DUF3307 domain-containing protein [Lutimaribacter sp. EGI FJ00013]MCO0611717.1 DUF3307 domain-containing protein [Lutimaribacter sp. EGI FJ00015]MCO0635161.1 DUF3307 domain-containing protein [Lutimaribacter sp. EGI FJ00014]
MTPSVIETFTALLFAHVLADFVFQTRAMMHLRRSAPMTVLHGAIVLVSAQATTGQVAAPELLALAAAHIAIDTVKTMGGFDRIVGFSADQAAHLATLGAVSLYAPTLWKTGFYAAHDWALPLMALAAGLIVTITAGQHAVGLLMRPHGARVRNNGLRDGGRLIGMLERGLIFLLIGLGQPLGVGFLVGAKSILRFGTATRDQRTAEYVIIGTLASFGWAITASYATQALLSALPRLEIMPHLP